MSLCFGKSLSSSGLNQIRSCAWFCLNVGPNSSKVLGSALLWGPNSGKVLGSALPWGPNSGKVSCLGRYPTVKPLVLGAMQKNILNGICFQKLFQHVKIIIHMSRLGNCGIRLLYNQLKVAMFKKKKGTTFPSLHFPRGIIY
jgi:hypothetical protein